jgi:hypothetical protein
MSTDHLNDICAHTAAGYAELRIGAAGSVGDRGDPAARDGSPVRRSPHAAETMMPSRRWVAHSPV